MEKKCSPRISIVEGTGDGESSCSGDCFSRSSVGDDASETCRVCQCVEPDRRGDSALRFLGILPPFIESSKNSDELVQDSSEISLDGSCSSKNQRRGSAILQFISTDADVCASNSDPEMGYCQHQDPLMELGCSCKNDLALVHYACALKWFINHGSTTCEICGSVAKNIRNADVNRIVGSLKTYEALRERRTSGEEPPAQSHIPSCMDPDSVSGIRRQRLNEIASWFTPYTSHDNVNTTTVPFSDALTDQPLEAVMEDIHRENSAAKWAVEGTGILLATALLTVTLAWLIAPRVGKRTARRGLHILLGGVCALAVVVFFRFVVLRRIRLGPARYWAILFVFWFLVFSIWASWTHGARKTT